MFKNKILKKLGAGLMAGLCAFTLIGANLGGFKTTAAETAKEPLLSGDEVIRQAATYLGVPYGWDCKGYDGVYSSSNPTKQCSPKGPRLLRTCLCDPDRFRRKYRRIPVK